MNLRRSPFALRTLAGHQLDPREVLARYLTTPSAPRSLIAELTVVVEVVGGSYGLGSILQM